MMERCKSLAGFILGHKFRARFHEGKPTIDNFRRGSAHGICAIIEASKPLTYVHDICERCGEIRKAGK